MQNRGEGGKSVRYNRPKLAWLLTPSPLWKSKGVFTLAWMGTATLALLSMNTGRDRLRIRPALMRQVDEAKVAIVGYFFGGIGVMHYLNASDGGTNNHLRVQLRTIPRCFNHSPCLPAGG